MMVNSRRLDDKQEQREARIVDQRVATRHMDRLTSEGRARTARSAVRLHADVELHRRLADENFEGPSWDRFVEALVEYAFPILTTWIVRGEIRGHVARNTRVLLEAPPSPITQEDAEDLASETIADALRSFRDRVLRANRWDPSRGTALTTWWIGYCLLRFPDVYRRWQTAQRKWSFSLRAAEQLRSLGLELGPDDPADQLIMHEELAHALASVPSGLTQQILQLKAQGYRYREISEVLGCSVKSIESRLARHWRQVRAC
ncbi:MAG: hypothetical protein OXG69_16950 [bacterium]|nr:hypothetical protein [bacterium]